MSKKPDAVLFYRENFFYMKDVELHPKTVKSLRKFAREHKIDLRGWLDLEVNAAWVVACNREGDNKENFVSLMKHYCTTPKRVMGI